MGMYPGRFGHRDLPVGDSSIGRVSCIGRVSSIGNQSWHCVAGTKKSLGRGSSIGRDQGGSIAYFGKSLMN